jgi:hypothetical protein
MASSEPAPVYPAKCPSCGENEGLPIGATVGATHGAVIVDLRCRACLERWTEELPKPTPARVNGDRRYAIRTKEPQPTTTSKR